ncbi:MAG: flagellar filament capping protein FliD, partial [Pyrinomonas methylaliphatogenes]|nr:flagellar filament capping protein FliD [Pyrinomonas methylaliphatogenes]
SPADYSQLDAEVSINGLVVHRATNKISDLVAGVTFELKATGTTTVSVANDTQAVANKIKAFVDAYNSVQDFILSQQNDPSGKAGGPLAADATLRAVQRNLRDALSASAVNDGGAFTNLTEIGIGRDEQGKLTLDQAKLDDRLRNAFSDTIALLAGKTSSNVGLADQILTVSSSMSDQISGSVQSAIKGYTDSVSRLDKLIADQQARLDALRQSLTRQFAAVDAAISQLNGQGTALSNIIKSLQPQSNNK